MSVYNQSNIEKLINNKEKEGRRKGREGRKGRRKEIKKENLTSGAEKMEK